MKLERENYLTPIDTEYVRYVSDRSFKYGIKNLFSLAHLGNIHIDFAYLAVL